MIGALEKYKNQEWMSCVECPRREGGHTKSFCLAISQGLHLPSLNTDFVTKLGHQAFSVSSGHIPSLLYFHLNIFLWLHDNHLSDSHVQRCYLIFSLGIILFFQIVSGNSPQNRLVYFWYTLCLRMSDTVTNSISPFSFLLHISVKILQ